MYTQIKYIQIVGELLNLDTFRERDVGIGCHGDYGTKLKVFLVKWIEYRIKDGWTDLSTLSLSLWCRRSG